MKIILILTTSMWLILLAWGCENRQQVSSLSSEAVIKIIADYIKEKVNESGSFAFEDKEENRTRDLQYVQIYEPAQQNKDGSYYTCVDFVDGTDTLDIDIYVTTGKETPEISKMVLHKVNGEVQ